MSQEVLSSQYSVNYYDEGNKLIHQIWKNESESMTTEDFKADMLGYAGLYEKYDVNFVLVDSKEMRFAVVPEVQDWVNINVLAKIAPFAKKIAFLVSGDLFEQISIEQAMEENEGLPIDTMYFDDEEKAREWLLK